MGTVGTIFARFWATSFNPHSFRSCTYALCLLLCAFVWKEEMENVEDT